MSFWNRRSLLAAGVLAIVASPLAAQGVGTTAVQVAQMPAGARAAALSGAYTAVVDDADVLFYNPGGIAGLFRAAGLSYQRHVMDVSLGSLAGAARVGPVVVGVGVAYLDAGQVQVVECTPAFPTCERGEETGATASARETATRLALGAPLFANRVHVGGAVGFATSETAGASRSAPLFDLGVQGVLPFGLTVGAAMRNLGGSLSDGGGELPTEARLGASLRQPVAGEFGAMVAADLISRLREETFGAGLGVEAGLVPADAERLGAVLRLGYQVDDHLEALNALQLGAGVSMRGISVDYYFQGSSELGAAHRIGVRWRQRTQ